MLLITGVIIKHTRKRGLGAIPRKTTSVRLVTAKLNHNKFILCSVNTNLLKIFKERIQQLKLLGKKRFLSEYRKNFVENMFDFSESFLD